jgi:hypothetical protein
MHSNAGAAEGCDLCFSAGKKSPDTSRDWIGAQATVE